MANGATPDDDIAMSLAQLADGYEGRLASVASVHHDDSYGRASFMRPYRVGAQPVGWADFGDELGLYVGEYGWWELDRRPEDVNFIRLVCDAVINGNGYEVTAPARSLVVLVLADDQAARHVNGQGCLLELVPMPG